MTRDKGSGGSGGAPKNGREGRLAERLRQNLRRRKAQARARRQTNVFRDSDGERPDAAEPAPDEQD